MHVLENLTERVQHDISDALYESAKVNAAATGDLLVPYAPDLDRFPFQSLSIRADHFRVKGSPLPFDKTFGTLALIDSRTAGLEQSLEEQEALETAGRVLESGQNVVFGTDHAELIDIAVFAAGSSALLRGRDVEHRSAIMASKAVDYLGVNTESFGFPPDIIDAFLAEMGLEIQPDRTVPVRDFLGLAVDTQYLSIPNTQSFIDLRGIQGEAVEAHNGLVKRAISNSMSRRGIKRQPPLALYAAMPGTKNKPLDANQYAAGHNLQGHYVTLPSEFPTGEEKSVEIIGHISSKVADFMNEALAFAAATRLEHGQAPRVSIDKEFQVLNDSESVAAFGGRLAVIATQLDQAQRVYDVKGNLPIKKSVAR